MASNEARKAREGSPTFTPKRSEQLIRMAASSVPDKDMARTLGISESTVKTYWKRLMLLYDAHSRTEVVYKFQKAEWEKKEEQLKKEIASTVQEEVGEIASLEAFDGSLEAKARLIASARKRLRAAKSNHEALNLWEAATSGTVFAYRLEPQEPYRCLDVSPSVEAFGLSRENLLVDRENLRECVYEADVPALAGWFQPGLGEDGTSIAVYRLKTGDALRWVLDFCHWQPATEGQSASIVGFIANAQALVDAQVLPEVARAFLQGTGGPWFVH